MNSCVLIPPDLADDEFLKRGASVSPECFLRSLQEKRRRGWQVCQDNGIAIDIASKIYSDAGHFVYELLQNAEDAKADTVSFCLNDDALTMTHNGGVFSRSDVMSITAVGTSTKSDLNAIGKFGVGFKSVFAVCDRPEIYSGGLCFAIENDIIPQPLSSLAAYAIGNKTVIRLPLKESSDGNLWEKIRQTLDGLGAAALLFLQNICRLEWQFGQDGEKHYCQKDGDLKLCGDNISAGVIELHGEDIAESYLLLCRREEIGGKSVYVKVAYWMHSEGDINSIFPPSLSVYFPLTKESPGLSFFLHIPYKTTPTRETCDFDDAENQMLTTRAAAFFADTLPILRDKGKLIPRVVNNVLPWERGHHTVYYAIANAVKDKFLSDKLLPTVCGNYAAAQDVIATDEYMPDITNAGFVGDFCNKKYDNRTFWLRGIGADARKALDILFYGIGDFLRDANDEMLSQLTDEQMIILYRKSQIYYEQKTKWQCGRRTQYNINRHEINKRIEKSYMRNYPIVRLQKPHDGKYHISAADVRLPKNDGNSVFPTVARVFLEDDVAMSFLKEVLDIKEPSDIDEIGEIIKNKLYADSEVVCEADIEKKHIADMRKILQVAVAEADEVRGKVAGKPIVKTMVSPLAFSAFDNSFMDCEDLRLIFAGYSDVRFVDESFYDKAFGDAEFADGGGWRDLFKKLGAQDTFVIGTDADKLEKLRYALQGIADSNDGGGFDRSVALWRFLARSIPVYDYERVLPQIFTPFSWFYDADKTRIAAGEIGEYALEDIHPRYKEELELADADIAAVSKIVGLKYDDVKILRGQLDRKDEELRAANQKIRQLESQLAMHKSPPVKPDEELPEIVVISRPVSTGETRTRKIPRTAPATAETKEIPVQPAPPAEGRRGEELLCKWLRQQYPNADIVNANDDAPNNPGYDIKVTDNGVTKYYECKSFVGAKPPSQVQMTRTQMEMAKQEEYNYFLCVICDIDANPAKMLQPIPNPYSLDRIAAEWSVDITEYHKESPPD